MANTTAPASVITSGTVQIFDHWNFPPDGVLLHDESRKLRPQEQPDAVGGDEDQRLGRGADLLRRHVAHEHLSADHEEHVRQTVKRLHQRNQQVRLSARYTPR